MLYETLLSLLSLLTLAAGLYVAARLLSTLSKYKHVNLQLKKSSCKLSDLINTSKNLSDFFQRVSGVSVLQQCKFGSCQYAGVASAIETMKILKEHGVDPLEFFGIQKEALLEQSQKEADVLNVLVIQLAALTTSEGAESPTDQSFPSSSSLSSFGSSYSLYNNSFSSVVNNSSETNTTEAPSPRSPSRMTPMSYPTSPSKGSPSTSASPKQQGFEVVSEETAFKFSHMKTVDEVFQAMKETSFDLWTVSRLAFQSAFNREMNSFILPSRAAVPSHWLTKELCTDTASSFRTGMECYILGNLGFIKNIDESLKGFQT